MILRVNKHTAVGLVLWAVCCIIPAAAVAADPCDTNSGYVDPKAQGFFNDAEMFADCIDRGRTLRGDFHETVLRDIYPRGNGPIKFRPETDGVLKVGAIRRGCLSMMSFDVVCRRQANLFTSAIPSLNQCPLPRLYSPSEADIVNFALSRLVPRGFCTMFSAEILVNPVQLVGGRAKGVTFTTNRFNVVSNSIAVLDTTTDQIEFGGLVIQGDLKIEAVKAKSLSLYRLVVLGDLVIQHSALGYMSLRNSWVSGDVIVRDNSFADPDLSGASVSDVMVGKTLTVSGNLAGSAQPRFSFYDVDLLADPVVAENKYSGPDGAGRQQIADFEQQVRDARARSLRLRARQN
jgi:hypothetical protein